MREEINLQAEAQLTQALDSLSQEPYVAPDYLAARVLSRLADPATANEPFDAALAWFRETLWRGAVAAALPIILGLVVGSINVTDQDDWNEAEMWVFADVLEEYDSNEI